MAVENTLFTQIASHPVIFDFGPSKTQVDYCFVRRKQRNFFKDIKPLPSEGHITHHMSLECYFKIRKVKDTRRKFVPRGKIMETTLHEDNLHKE